MGKTKLCACLVYSQAELVCVRINMYCAQSLSLLICELLHASGGGCGGWGGGHKDETHLQEHKVKEEEEEALK